MYPLGSCTMKYNARVNEYVARLTDWRKRIRISRACDQGALRILQC